MFKALVTLIPSKTLALLILSLPLLAFGEENTETIETVTVIGTKTERSLDQIGASISLIDREAIERQLSRDIADVVRYEPGVSVGGSGSRFGLSGFNIRGIEGNRVLTIVDGIRVPDEFSFGPFLSARRDFVDVDSLELVEIARGPISSLYGSDALGGVVSLTTRNPSSYLSDRGGFAANLKTGYSSDDESAVASINLALGDETLAGLLSYTKRKSKETKTAGKSGGLAEEREEADPLDAEVDNFKLKLTYAPVESHLLTFTVEDFQSQVDQEIRSDYGSLLTGRGPPTLISERDAFDEKDRSRISLTYEVDGNGWADKILARIYSQESNTSQVTKEVRRPGVRGAPLFRVRSSEFEQEIEGVYLHITNEYALRGLLNTVTYGTEVFETYSSSIRDGSTADANGVAQREFTNFPTRDFPITDVKQTAFFLQNESVLADERLRLTVGARYDDFEADADGDLVYFSGNPGSPTPAGFEDSETTLSASVVYQLAEQFSSFFRYSEGFRAPPYDDVNVGFTNPIGGYKTISNPELNSETSQGLELGLRWDGDFGNASLSLYQNKYEDFIETLSIAPAFMRFGGVDPSDGFLTFQSVNRASVEIDGVEASAKINLGMLLGFSERLTIRLAAAYANGEDTSADEPLNTINPLSAVIGLEYEGLEWGTQLVLTAVEEKDEADIAGSRLKTSGYGILDLIGYVDLSDSATLNFGLFNLTNKTYIRWADTVSIGSDAPARFSQPGFNAGLSLRVDL